MPGTTRAPLGIIHNSQCRAAGCRTLVPRPHPPRRRRPPAPPPRRAAASAPGDADDGDGPLRVPQPPKSPTLSPSFWLSAEDAVNAQLKALQHNAFPTHDAGVETLYRFAEINPFERSDFFGRMLDLGVPCMFLISPRLPHAPPPPTRPSPWCCAGQFERFRRIVYSKCFAALVNHTESQVVSSLGVEEDVRKFRVRVANAARREERTYEFTMRRSLGGRYDGVWFCGSLRCDGCDDTDKSWPCI